MRMSTLVLLGLSLGFGPAVHGAVDAGRLVRSLEGCRSLPDAERIRCYDALVDELGEGAAPTGTAPPAAAAAADAPREAQSASSAPDAATAAPAPVASAAATPGPPAAAPPASTAEPPAAAPAAAEARPSAPGIESIPVAESGPEAPAAADPAPVAAAGEPAEEPEIAAEALFGREQSDAKEMIEEAFGVRRLDAIEVSVARVEKSAYGKLILAMDNGQIWMQLDSARLNLRAGDGVRIKSAMSGSFLLEKQTGSRSIRVRRVD